MHIWSASRRLPTVEEFGAEMDKLLTQSITFFVENRRAADPVGFVQAYNMNPGDGWCFALVYTGAKYRRRGHGVEAFAMLLDYLFRNFALRKVYADVYEFNMESLGPLVGGGFVEEGRLRQHTWFNDQYWDVIRLAMYREAWYEFRGRTHLLVGVGEEAAELLAEQHAPAGDGADPSL